MSNMRENNHEMRRPKMKIDEIRVEAKALAITTKAAHKADLIRQIQRAEGNSVGHV